MSPNAKPLPQEIYMRRRAAALIAILVVVAVLIAAWFGMRKDPETTPTAASGSTAASALSEPPVATSTAPAEESTAAETAKPSEAASASAVETTAASEEAKPGEKKDCQLADLVVSASPDKANYASGELPKFFMEVKNPTAGDCEIDLSKDVLRFEVYKLGDYTKVWTDVDCFPPVETGKQKFKAGESRVFEATWSRLGSAPDKCEQRPQAENGAYLLHAVIGNNNSEAQTFNLV